MSQFPPAIAPKPDAPAVITVARPAPVAATRLLCIGFPVVIIRAALARALRAPPNAEPAIAPKLKAPGPRQGSAAMVTA